LNWGDATTGYVQDIAAALSLNPSAASQLFNGTRVALNPQDLSGSALQAALSLLFYSILGNAGPPCHSQGYSLTTIEERSTSAQATTSH
jgi:hypothetical protein